MMADMGIVVFIPLYVIACALLTLSRAPGSIRERLSDRWPALALLVLALLTFGIFSDQYAVPFAIVVLAGLLVLVAPAAAGKAASYVAFGLGGYGLFLQSSPTADIAFYGFVPRPYSMVWTFTTPTGARWGSGMPARRPVTLCRRRWSSSLSGCGCCCGPTFRAPA